MKLFRETYATVLLRVAIMKQARLTKVYNILRSKTVSNLWKVSITLGLSNSFLILHASDMIHL
jgi:hypothetical protein